MSRKKIIFISFCGLIIVAYLLFRIGFIFSEYSNPLANLLFDIISFLSTIAIAYIVSIDIATKQQKEKLKEQVISHIRNIRTRINALYRLLIIINKYYEDIEDEVHKQYFEEIKNHIIEVYLGLIASENDFKDLVGEELKEYYKLLSFEEEKQKELLEKIKDKAPKKEIQIIQSDIIDAKSKSKIGGFGTSSGEVTNDISTGVLIDPVVRGLYLMDLASKAKKGKLL